MRKLMETEKEEENNIERKKLSIAVPMVILDEIDALLKKKIIRMPRHTWMLEALCEKLEREIK
jgi:hypothetical protein